MRGRGTIAVAAGTRDAESAATANPAARRPGVVAIAVLLAAAILWIYLASPAQRPLDPRFAILTAESLLERGSWNLAPYLPHLAPGADAAGDPPRLPYQLNRRGGALLYFFPPGTPLLTAPLLALARPFGASSLRGDGSFDPDREWRLHKVLGSLLSVAIALMIFALARHEAGALAASVTMLVAALGGPLWTVTSRALWSQTWSALLGVAVLLELVRWEDGGRARPVLLGGMLTGMVWVRPSNALTAALVLGFVFAVHRRQVLRATATVAAGAAGFAVWSSLVWGKLLPPYVLMERPWSDEGPWLAFLKILGAPRYGLLVFSPVLLAVAWVLLRRGLPGRRVRLARLVLAWIASHLVLLALTGPNWGLAGPRLSADLVGPLAWLGALASAAPRDADRRPRSPLRRRAGIAATGLLCAASVLASFGAVYVLQGPRLSRTWLDAAAEAGAGASWAAPLERFWIASPFAPAIDLLAILLGRS